MYTRLTRHGRTSAIALQEGNRPREILQAPGGKVLHPPRNGAMRPEAGRALRLVFFPMGWPRGPMIERNGAYRLSSRQVISFATIADRDITGETHNTGTVATST